MVQNYGVIIVSSFLSQFNNFYETNLKIEFYSLYLITSTGQLSASFPDHFLLVGIDYPFCYLCNILKDENFRTNI
jgi:hypothetical protein